MVFVRSFRPINVVFVRFGVVVFVRGKLPGITGFCEKRPGAALSGPRARVPGGGRLRRCPARVRGSCGHPRARRGRNPARQGATRPLRRAAAPPGDAPGRAGTMGAYAGRLKPARLLFNETELCRRDARRRGRKPPHQDGGRSPVIQIGRLPAVISRACWRRSLCSVSS